MRILSPKESDLDSQKDLEYDGGTGAAERATDYDQQFPTTTIFADIDTDQGNRYLYMQGQNIYYFSRLRDFFRL